MNNIKLCPRCKAVNVNQIKKALQSEKKKIDYDLGCFGFCGIGRTKAFAIVNNTPIVTDTNEELIIKIKEAIK